MAKILIVDDDAELASRIAGELKNAGHLCAVRGQGAGVLEIARKESLDLLLLDVMLPDISGFEVCRSIRRDPHLYTLPILFFSAMDDEEEIRHGLDQGADGYVTKPFNLQHLLSRIDSILRENSKADFIDHQTNLADAEGTRKLIQQRISRDDTFALIYIELKNLREFTPPTGDKGRNKVLRHFARTLRVYGDSYEQDQFFVGHLGGGHFICTVPNRKQQEYCEMIQQGWEKHLAKLCKAMGMTDMGVLGVVFCVTAREKGEFISAQQMLDTVSRIHKIADQEGLDNAIQLDRRLVQS